MMQIFYSKLSVNTLSQPARLYSVHLRLASITVSALLDTGSAISIISEEFWKSIPAGKRPTLGAYTRNPLCSASGHHLTVVGEVLLNLTLGNVKRQIAFAVIPQFNYPVLLGVDAFIKLGAVLNFKDFCLYTFDDYGQRVPIHKHDSPDFASVRLKHTIRIPPRTIVVTSGSMDKQF